MKKYLLRTILIHFAIMFAYIGLCDLKFVLMEDYDPIGNGIGQWLCFFCHLIFTIVLVCLRTSEIGLRKRLLINAFIVVGLFVFYGFIICPALNGWLGNIRYQLQTKPTLLNK